MVSELVCESLPLSVCAAASAMHGSREAGARPRRTVRMLRKLDDKDSLGSGEPPVACYWSPSKHARYLRLRQQTAQEAPTLLRICLRYKSSERCVRVVNRFWFSVRKVDGAKEPDLSDSGAEGSSTGVKPVQEWVQDNIDVTIA